jgi:Na+/H+-dicarboxylate symporter
MLLLVIFFRVLTIAPCDTMDNFCKAGVITKAYMYACTYICMRILCTYVNLLQNGTKLSQVWQLVALVTSGCLMAIGKFE